MRTAGQIPGFAQWVKDLALLWLWCRPMATALILTPSLGSPYVAPAVLKKKKDRSITVDIIKLMKYSMLEVLID